jgi:hypothetical protein
MLQLKNAFDGMEIISRISDIMLRDIKKTWCIKYRRLQLHIQVFSEGKATQDDVGVRGKSLSVLNPWVLRFSEFVGKETGESVLKPEDALVILI